MYGAIEAQSADEPAHCHGIKILGDGVAVLWDPTAPSVEMHLPLADLETFAEGRDLTWFSLKAVHADAGLPTDDGDAEYAIPAAGADALFQPGPGLQMAVDIRGGKRY